MTTSLSSDLSQHEALLIPLIEQCLQEDMPWGDVTTESLIDPEWKVSLALTLKQAGVVAGLPLAEKIFRYLDPKLQWEVHHPDGSVLEAGTCLATMEGQAQALLKAERLALNFLQRLSGIATYTRAFVNAAREQSSTVRIVDTRKTTPGLRFLEKYAVRMGGGQNHRYGLSDAVLVKDNHLAILRQHQRTLKEAMDRGQGNIPHTMKIEVEVDRLDQIEMALESGADIILLDNMDCETLKRAVQQINGRALAEASGGINLDTVTQVAATGVDQISIGALTHSAPSLDISLDFK